MVPERRRTSRVRCYLPIRLYPQGEHRVIETLSKNLGAGGMSCLSPVHKPIATPLSVELIVGQGQPPLNLHAQVIWFSEVPNSEQFQLGFSFDQMTEFKTRQLSVCVDKFTSHLSPAIA